METVIEEEFLSVMSRTARVLVALSGFVAVSIAAVECHAGEHSNGVSEESADSAHRSGVGEHSDASQTCAEAFLIARLAELEAAAGERRWSDFALAAKGAAKVDWPAVPLEVVPLERRIAMLEIANEAGYFTFATALARDVTAHRRRLADGSSDAVSWRNYIESVLDVGRLELILGDAAVAHACFLEGAVLARRSIAADGSSESRAILARCLDHLGLAEDVLGQGESARARHEESLAIRRKLSEAVASDENLRAVSVSLGRLAWIALASGDADTARRAVDESLAIQRSLAAAGSPRDIRYLSYSLCQSAAIHEAQGRGDAADAAMKEAIEIARGQAAGLASPRSIVDLADLQSRWAGFAWARGELAAARDLYLEALANYRLTIAAEPTQPAFRSLAYTLWSLSEIECSRSALGAAAGYAHESLAIRRSIAGQRYTPSILQEFCDSLESAASVKWALGNLDEALLLASESLVVRRRLAWESNADVGNARLIQAVDLVRAIRQRQGDFAIAVSLANERVELERLRASSDTNPARRSDLGAALMALGSAEFGRRDYESSLAHLLEAQSILQEVADRLQTPESRKATETCSEWISRVNWGQWICPVLDLFG